ncbi:UDP-N-acetyl-D-mannosamine dehydrogenase [Listeria aquatica FSL S10-1188]|uniref:UDP-N-acetyl-D-mannosamine dehydrogenase n=1 Tax=Listeria aquatica FSL S10-1188 TaxID=1265818 RepID=W7B2Q0_9LIST|nr:UDP-N-acetyl-D-mannosamine dehydrogenase [Listeria aquatica FSL S10-1188]
MKIVTIGLGYIGLPTAIMFANHNQEVIGVDVKEDVITMLNNGHVHLEEPGLETELKKSCSVWELQGTAKGGTSRCIYCGCSNA